MFGNPENSEILRSIGSFHSGEGLFGVSEQFKFFMRWGKWRVGVLFRINFISGVSLSNSGDFVELRKHLRRRNKKEYNQLIFLEKQAARTPGAQFFI